MLFRKMLDDLLQEHLKYLQEIYLRKQAPAAGENVEEEPTIGEPEEAKPVDVEQVKQVIKADLQGLIERNAVTWASALGLPGEQLEISDDLLNELTNRIVEWLMGATPQGG